jgi:hypothetical protein
MTGVAVVTGAVKTVETKSRYNWNLDRISMLLASIATAGILFDAIATYFAVEVFHVGQELNPVILWAAEQTNFGIAMVLRVFAGVALIMVFLVLIRAINTHREKLLSVYALGLAALMLTALSGWHIYIIITRIATIAEYLT